MKGDRLTPIGNGVGMEMIGAALPIGSGVAFA
jgi:hypothetical protein